MAVHNLLDLTIQFFVWWSEYVDPVFYLVLGMKVDLVIQFFVWLEGVGWMNGCNHPFIREGEYTPFKITKPTKLSIYILKKI
jgi:hypothetical protein